MDFHALARVRVSALEQTGLICMNLFYGEKNETMNINILLSCDDILNTFTIKISKYERKGWQGEAQWRCAKGENLGLV